MKAKDLIKELENWDPETEVHFAYNYGDHWRTEVAPKIRRVAEGMVDDSDEEDVRRVIVLE
jgi:hypothetical protein